MATSDLFVLMDQQQKIVVTPQTSEDVIFEPTLKPLWSESPPTDLVATASVLDVPEDDVALGGGGHHLVLVSVRTAHHLGVERDAFDGPVEVRRGKHLLPSGGFLYPARRHAWKKTHLRCIELGNVRHRVEAHQPP